MINDFRHRMGMFFHLVGLTLMVIFVGSMLSKATNVTYLFLAFAAFSIGFMLRRNKPVQDSGRFAFVRRAGQRNHARREDKLKKILRGKPARAGAGLWKARHERGRAQQDREEGIDNNQLE